MTHRVPLGLKIASIIARPAQVPKNSIALNVSLMLIRTKWEYVSVRKTGERRHVLTSKESAHLFVMDVSDQQNQTVNFALKMPR